MKKKETGVDIVAEDSFGPLLWSSSNPFVDALFGFDIPKKYRHPPKIPTWSVALAWDFDI
jgi:hypothetical protein